MILICGIPSEAPVARLLEICRAQELEHRVVNQRRVDDYRINFCVDHGVITGTLCLDSEALSLERVTGVYTRLMEPDQLPEVRHLPDDSPRRLRAKALHSALTEWLDAAPIRVVNRTGAMTSNSSKPYQSRIIKEAGFSVPETLITDDPPLIDAFRTQHGRVCYKSVSGTRSIVTELSDADMARINDISRCPVQFQQIVVGSEIRVHTIGTTVFATAVHSDALDYRYGHLTIGVEADLKETNLQDRVAQSCVTLASRLGLEMAGIDLKITPDGEVYCFEVNPSPAYSYYESNTGQPIAQTLAGYLGPSLQ